MNEQVDFATMSDREKYLFDLQGFLVVNNFLTPAEVQTLNEAVDANLDKRFERDPRRQGNGRFDQGEFASFFHQMGALTWDQPWCQPFRDLLAHPKVIPYLNTLMGRGWKLDHEVEVMTATAGCQGLPLHGEGNLNFNGSRLYRYQNGRMRCGLIVLQYYLKDANPGDGGLCVVPGSHKANFPMPQAIKIGEADQEIVHQIVAQAGDLVIFNEATAHGTLPWKGKGERRLAFYRYTPKYLHYHGGYYETALPEWASELTESQRAALDPPYIYHRPLIEDDGVTVTRPRREDE